MVAFAVLGYAAFEFAGHVTSHGAAQPAPAAEQQASKAAASASAASAAAASAAASAQAAPTPSATAPRTAAAPPLRTIAPVSAEAFGPDGTADGDNPQNAGRVLTDPADGWVTQWYATANFGALKQGTGLLLDMGRPVTIAAVRLTLGSYPGTSLELRLGRSGPQPLAQGPGESAVRPAVVHQAAAGRRGHLPGVRAWGHGPGPALANRYARGRADRNAARRRRDGQ